MADCNVTNVISNAMLIKLYFHNHKKHMTIIKVSSRTSWHGKLYYTRTNFMPFGHFQNKAKIYAVFLYPVYSSIHS